jgi:trk system potassium uptake protein TrkH
MAEGAAVLSYAVRPAVVGRYLGQLALVQAALTLVPLAVALAQGDHRFGGRLAAVAALLLVAGGPVARLPRPAHLQTNEGLVVVALAFTLSPLLMAWPLMADGLSFVDALFEAVSGLTTTGLTTLERVAGHSPAFLFTRAWLQWVGGLGFAVLAVALVLGPHADARRLVDADAPESTLTTAPAYARRVLGVYLALTLTGVLVLWATIGDGFAALLHILSAVSTGGFSPLDDSLAGLLSPGAAWVVTAWCLAGAVPLILYYRAAAGRPGALVGDAEVRALVVAVLVAAGLLALALHYRSGLDWSEALRHGLLLGASAQTTAGFSSLPVTALDPTAKLVAIVAMLIGGGVGSTAGGLKLLRLLVLLRLAQFALRRTALPPHAVAFPRLEGRNLETADVQRAAIALLLLVVVTAASWLVFVAAGHAPLDSLFEVVSAVGTVGLSTGITSPGLGDGLKLLLCADMLMGRLEIVAVLVLLYPPTWIARRVEAA